MGFEQRLMHCLDANLRHREEVIEEYGSKIDFMRDYSYKHDIAGHIADALNQLRGNMATKPAAPDVAMSDIGAYRVMHHKNNIRAYEATHGIKTFTFHITVPDTNRVIIMQKLGMPDWVGGATFFAYFFTDFHFNPLYFGTFGLVVSKQGRGYGDFQHEALHCDRRMYSANFAELVSFNKNLRYSIGLWRAKFQAFLIDEMLAFICTDTDKTELEAKLRDEYWQYYFTSTANLCFQSLKEDKKLVKQKNLELLLAPARAQIKEAVEASYYLKSQLPSDVLTPLFFSLGPNSAEVKQGLLHGPFSDIKHWAILLNNRAVTLKKIREALQKKGYCLEPAIISLP